MGRTKKVCWLSADLSSLHNSDKSPFLQCVWFFRTEEKCRNPTGGRERNICPTCQHFIVLINEYKPGVIVNVHVYVILEKWENLRQPLKWKIGLMSKCFSPGKAAI